MPDEDKHFRSYLVLDFRQLWRHVKMIYKDFIFQFSRKGALFLTRKLFPRVSLSPRQSSKQVTSLRILQLAPHTLVKRARNYQVKMSYRRKQLIFKLLCFLMFNLSVTIAICPL